MGGWSNTDAVFFISNMTLVEQNLIIRDSNGRNTELGIQRSQWVHSSPFINCVYPIYVPRMGLVQGTQRSKTGLALERLIGFRAVFDSLKSNGVW